MFLFISYLIKKKTGNTLIDPFESAEDFIV